MMIISMMTVMMIITIVIAIVACHRRHRHHHHHQHIDIVFHILTTIILIVINLAHDTIAHFSLSHQCQQCSSENRAPPNRLKQIIIFLINNAITGR